MKTSSLIFRATLAIAAVAAPAIYGNRPLQAQDPAEEHPLVPALRLAESSREAVAELRDYDAAFAKRDVVNDQVFAHTLLMKFRAEPMSVYMRFYKPHEGREVIYVDGRNDGKLLAHETGIKSIVGTVALDPHGPQAMSESRHPITRVGMTNLVSGVIAQWQRETKYGECEVNYYPNAKLRAMECQVIEVKHPVPRRQFPFHMTRLFIDKKTNFPVRVEQYVYPAAPGQQPPLIEEYRYWNIRTNLGFSDVDFDPRNPRYAFN